MAEAAAIGGRIGCPIRQSGEERNAVTRKLGAFKTSMLQDVEAGKPLEIDGLLTAVSEIGRRVEVPTPSTDALLGLTRVFAAGRGLYQLASHGLSLPGGRGQGEGVMSMTAPRPPFRADHVGSLLRPPALRALRIEQEAGRATAAELAAAEDAAVREAVRLQEEVGLLGITDGEMRRRSWHMDFLTRLGGLASEGRHLPVTFHGPAGDVHFTRPDLRIASRVTRPAPILVDAFRFLRSTTSRTAKLTAPSPCMLYSQVGRAGIDRGVYPELDAFVEDTAAAYRAEIADLHAAGCRYLQLDDVSLAYLCDEDMRAQMRARGEDPDQVLALSVKLIRATLRDRPRDLVVCTHLCRGNFRSSWRAQGGYEKVAEVIFNQMPYDGFFLEFDDARSGDFAPLRFVPPGVRVVLGLVTSKVGALESKDALTRRLEEAAKYVPLEQVCLSPQCGFSSTLEGNVLTVEQQRAKLALCVEVARDVWGSL
jgi:5-methyltetrahydropteroyltriglutamate--homocysteine methyltransferase